MAVMRMTFMLVLTLALARTSLACFCVLRHPQEMFCIADFVVRLEVIDMEEIYSNDVPNYSFPMEVRYTVDISYVFKGSEKFDQADKVYLLTGGSDGTCRQDLVVGELYVIMGYVHDGHMSFGMCDWTRRLGDLTSHQYRGLHYKYTRGCDCQIQRCFGPECNVRSNRNDTCQWTNTNECDQNYGFCVEGPGGSCAWRQNRMRSGCLNSLSDA
ncbi:metalloproteinase inhibitor 2-like [Mizuhopecten yessoensis]|uniref:Metalloproteinase inhibitor 2 n=1 Tax=Mizuhopecten yessoensis TaxID=6573 RepID=A0A210QSD2_MIZYE|nr:metalloproteinase inhibitor 2-like [Mizuhopecten yessoensis]OWF51635.1 Metalloproteinase inhibitor 2 [Mizuhopecten yessoensis]